MSWNLIKKSQELLDNDTAFSNSSLKFNKADSTQQNLKKKSKNLKQKGSKKSLSERKIKDAFKFTENKLKDPTNDNIKILKRLDEKLVLTNDAHKVKEFRLQKLEKQRLKPEDLVKTKKQPTKSVFSEEDFERMNEQWLSIDQ